MHTEKKNHWKNQKSARESVESTDATMLQLCSSGAFPTVEPAAQPVIELAKENEVDD
jgi:hypothetical protein